MPRPTKLTVKIPRVLEAAAEGPLAVTLLFGLALAMVGVWAWLGTIL